MFLNHIALFCSSEEKSDRFYQDVLGLDKRDSKVLSSNLSKQIFNLEDEFNIINYANDDIEFEIFIANQKEIDKKRVDHICIEVQDRKAFLEICTAMEVEILKIPKGDSLLIFVKDYDGNIFEIKQKQ